MSYAQPPLCFSVGVNSVRDRAAVERADFVFERARSRVEPKLCACLRRSRYFEGAAFNSINLSVGLHAYERVERRYTARSAQRRLTVSFSVDARVLSTMRPRDAANDLEWTVLDILINEGGQRRLDVATLAGARAKLHAPHEARNAFSGVLGSSEEPVTVDPFPFRLSIRIPIRGLGWSPRRAKRAQQDLREVLDMTLGLQPDGAVDELVLEDGEMVCIVSGPARSPLAKEVSAALGRLEWAAPATVRPMPRRT